MEAPQTEVDERTLKQLLRCFRWIECSRDGGTRQILFLDGDELAKLQEVHWIHQHAICMVRGFDESLQEDPGWATRESYPRVIELSEIHMRGIWGVLDYKRHAAIAGGGNKMQKRMLAMVILLAGAVKLNKVSELPKWWTRTGYVSQLVQHLIKKSRVSDRRSRSPVKLVAARARSKSEAKSSSSEPQQRKKRRNGSTKCSSRTARADAAQAVEERMKDKAMEKLRQELAEVRALAEAEREEKEAALQAAQEAQTAEALALDEKASVEEEKARAEEEKAALLKEKEDAVLAAQAAAESEAAARQELLVLAEDTEKVLSAIQDLANNSADEVRVLRSLAQALIVLHILVKQHGQS
ncbi:Lamb2 [Symbiodinium natans]|uniref:Lamb2 protein n=1 Tax=Symbiodinium natans TaxID=878477 RepID=A0A812I4Y0_9DINO|nr:Lamb2 [Symbiodinium natans]